MTRSVATIAQQSLRRLGVRVVPLDDSPTLTETVPAATIATQALVELGVIASDETPLASDQALMLDRVASVHASLDAQGMVFWQGGAIPRAFAEEYTKLTAAFGASAFGKAVDPAVVKLLEGRVRAGVMVRWPRSGSSSTGRRSRWTAMPDPCSTRSATGSACARRRTVAARRASAAVARCGSTARRASPA